MPDWEKLRPEGGLTFVDKGDNVEGNILKMEEVPTLGEQARLTLKVTVRTAAGAEVAFHTPSNLLAAFCDQQPNVGDWIRVELTGFKHTGKASPLKIFDLTVRPAAEAAAKPSADDL
jgi:hypothetical protein